MAAQLLDACHIVAHKKNCSAFGATYILHLSDSLFLEFCIANSQHLINNQYLRFKECCYGKS